MNTATTSVSICPASASSAIELINSEVVNSTTKNAARIAAARIMRGIMRGASASLGVWSWPAPITQKYIRGNAYMTSGSDPPAPEAGQRVARKRQLARHAGEFEQPRDDPEDPRAGRQEQKQENQKAELL